RTGPGPGTAAGPGTGTGSDDEVKVVFVVDHGKARLRRVGTGISDETRVEVASGLAPGESVVTGPYRSLRDLKAGDTVQVVTPSRPGAGGDAGEPDRDRDRTPGGGGDGGGDDRGSRGDG